MPQVVLVTGIEVAKLASNEPTSSLIGSKVRTCGVLVRGLSVMETL